MKALNAALIKAHEGDDKEALIELYTEAADLAETDDETAFFLTFAYVFALETGSACAEALKVRLVAAGREE